MAETQEKVTEKGEPSGYSDAEYYKVSVGSTIVTLRKAFKTPSGSMSAALEVSEGGKAKRFENSDTIDALQLIAQTEKFESFKKYLKTVPRLEPNR